MLEMRDEDIGGARVRRTFTRNGRHLKMGEHLNAEDVLSIPIANRRALTDSSFLELYPKANVAGGERFVVGLGGGDKYNVIEGRVINDAPLTKKEAEKLAHS